MSLIREVFCILCPEYRESTKITVYSIRGELSKGRWQDQFQNFGYDVILTPVWNMVYAPSLYCDFKCTLGSAFLFPPLCL